MNVMLVDDSIAMRRILRNVLEEVSIKDIVEAIDGKDALEKLTETLVDVILLDINMPRMDGFTFLKTIRGIKKFKSVKVIMCTSESEKERIMETLKSGADSYIVKPFTADILKEKLKDLKLLGENQIQS